MIIYKYRDTEEQEIGSLLGIKNMGIKTRDIIISEIAEPSKKQNMTIKHFLIDPNKVYPAHPSPLTQVTLIVSGKGTISSKDVEFELEAGDLAHICAGELYSIRNLGDTELRVVCFAINSNSS